MGLPGLVARVYDSVPARTAGYACTRPAIADVAILDVFPETGMRWLVSLSVNRIYILANCGCSFCVGSKRVSESLLEI